MRRLLMVLSAMALTACLEEIRTCRPAAPIQSFNVFCAPPDDAGLSRSIVVTEARRKDAMPVVSSDFGCHFTTDGGDLVVVGDGQVCERLGYDETDVMFLTRECVPPIGAWRLGLGNTLVSIDVTDAGIRCGR